jgi:leader peptidase (prepilin peptidase)/N-methyltransferase
MTTILAAIGLAVAGLAVGSFLNVCIDRLPAGKSIIRLRSHCDACNQGLQNKDLIPLFSYLRLRGRCRHCGARIPRRVFLVELGAALIFGLLAWNFGPGLELAFALIYACIFLVIFVIDLEHQLILDMVVYPAMALAFIFSFFWFGAGDYPHWPQAGVLSALLGGAAGLVFMIIPYFIARAFYGKEGMGEGDVYLGALIGLVTGFPLVFVALIIGILGGGVVAVGLLALRIKKRRDPIPFGPFLAAAAMVTLIWGLPILDWYTGLV